MELNCWAMSNDAVARNSTHYSRWLAMIFWNRIFSSPISLGLIFDTDNPMGQRSMFIVVVVVCNLTGCQSQSILQAPKQNTILVWSRWNHNSTVFAVNSEASQSKMPSTTAAVRFEQIKRCRWIQWTLHISFKSERRLECYVICNAKIVCLCGSALARAPL